MKLSENFTLAELTFSETALRKGLDNTPSPAIVRNLRMLTSEVLQPSRNACGRILVNSGYRAPAVNRAVGGSKKSDHLEGLAADIEPLDVTLHELGWWIQTNLPFKQLILEFGSWLHVSFVPHALKKQVLEAFKIEGETHYRPYRFARPANVIGPKGGGRRG